ncbi:hypothetical protein ACSFA3_04000 [Variovorax sp. RHLX14]|uniref:hypothetical protein n=1 Tax=Variovorax sp. RHLX14 TaxID=1259731 RepID=UPI003F464735
MSEVINNLMGGNVLGAISSLFKESPQENIREAAIDILKGEKVDKNMEKLTTEMQRTGGDREKITEVNELMQTMASGKADQTSTMEQILAIVGPKDAEKMGLPPSGKRMKSDSIQF